MHCLYAPHHLCFLTHTLHPMGCAAVSPFVYCGWYLANADKNVNVYPQYVNCNFPKVVAILIS